MIKLFKVGEYVWDFLQGKKTRDPVFAVEAPDYNSLVTYVGSQGGRIYGKEPRFGKLRARVNGSISDYVWCHEEKLHKKVHPEELKPLTIVQYLAHRDFTINALALDENDQLIDPCGGRDDFHAGRLRCVGKAVDKFTENALSLVKALRLHITMGFTLDPEIVHALRDREVVARLDRLPRDSIREQMQMCFKHNTLLTLETLQRFPEVRNRMFRDKSGLWLKPTVELRK